MKKLISVFKSFFIKKELTFWDSMSEKELSRMFEELESRYF